jgi:hypothetical protein
MFQHCVYAASLGHGYHELLRQVAHWGLKKLYDNSQCCDPKLSSYRSGAYVLWLYDLHAHAEILRFSSVFVVKVTFFHVFMFAVWHFYALSCCDVLAVTSSGWDLRVLGQLWTIGQVQGYDLIVDCH